MRQTGYTPVHNQSLARDSSSITRANRRIGAAHSIRLPNGRGVSVGSYCRVWRTLRRLPSDYPVIGWDYSAVPAGDVLRAIQAGCVDRINPPASGRKHEPQWQSAVSRLAWLLRSHRIIRERDIPIELRQRLAHVIDYTEID